MEDDDRLRSALARLVQSWNTEVMEGRTISEGAALLSSNPDLVIMDVRLPDGSGVEVAEAARKIEPAPMVVAISGAASAAEAFELARAGVRAFVPKPFSQGEFVRRIGWALEARSAEPGGWQANLPAELKAALEVNLQRLSDQQSLTARQVEVIRLAIAGVPRTRFAERLGVTENTCKTTVRRVLRKCGARRLADIPRLLLTWTPEHIADA